MGGLTHHAVAASTRPCRRSGEQQLAAPRADASSGPVLSNTLPGTDGTRSSSLFG